MLSVKYVSTLQMYIILINFFIFFILFFQLGFFRRAKKEELKVLVRQSQAHTKQEFEVDEGDEDTLLD